MSKQANDKYKYDHVINVGYVMGEIFSNWESFDRTFLAETVQRNAEYLQIIKGVRTVTMPDEEFYNSKYFKNYDHYREECKKEGNCPIPDYHIYASRDK